MMTGNRPFFGCSERGPAHKRLGMPNQDAWIARVFPRGALLVVCDGMGSCQQGREGARAACHAALAAAVKFINHPSLDFIGYLAMLHAYWRLLIQPFKVDECRTTCLLALWAHGALYLAQLGDGMIAVCGESGCLLPFGEDEKEFANVSTGLGGKFQPEQWKTASLKNAASVLLATDGVSDDIPFQNKEPFARDCMAHFFALEYGEREKVLRKMLQNWPTRGHTDDKTLAAMLAPACYKTGGRAQMACLNDWV